MGAMGSIGGKEGKWGEIGGHGENWEGGGGAQGGAQVQPPTVTAPEHFGPLKVGSGEGVGVFAYIFGFLVKF